MCRLLQRLFPIAAEQGVQIVCEPERERGSLRFESPQGEVDTDLRLQVDRLVESLRHAMVSDLPT